MSMQRGKLADIQQIASAAGSVYSNPAATKTYIRGFVIHNTNATSEVVELWNVPDAAGSLGAAADANKFLRLSVPTNDTVFIELPQPIVLTDTNDSIQAKTTTASKVSLQILGDKDA